MGLFGSIRIWVDRTEYNLGDLSDMSGAQLRHLANVPDTHDLWEEGRTPIDGDRKVDPNKTVYFGNGAGRPPRFFTAPKIINNSAVVLDTKEPDRPIFAAECVDCGNKWTTTNDNDVCPKCHSINVRLGFDTKEGE